MSYGISAGGYRHTLNVELTSYTAPEKSLRQKLVSELHGS